MQEGSKVRLVSPEAIARFGDSIYTVVRVRRDLNAVEVDELGTVAVSDVVEVDEDGEPLQNIPKKADLSAPGRDSSKTESGEDFAGRIEAVAGSLLSHPDPNVRLSMREILSLLWEG